MFLPALLGDIKAVYPFFHTNLKGAISWSGLLLPLPTDWVPTSLYCSTLPDVLCFLCFLFKRTCVCGPRLTHTHKKIKILKLLFPLFWAFSWYFRRLVLATLLTAGRSESASVWNHQHFHWFILKTVLCFPNSGAERRISSTRMHGYLDPCAAVVCHVC